ncbi:MAG: aminotransferase class V-fold PLP-dependent enzyme [Lachnospiraceae bacterium]|nr:aminotransferase class V-fold PLP-dependent enzyme [Lachnospiraceae bacterium]
MRELAYGTLFTAEELQEIRSKFYYVDRDYEGNHRLFFDNAGGSLRLKAAQEAFARIAAIPDASDHSNRVARYLDDVEKTGRKDLLEVLFGAKSGVLYPSYTASQIMMEVGRVIAANAKGSNVVTTTLEHPSAYDAMTLAAEQSGRELRVAKVNPATGGVDADEIISLIDENTAIVCCMAASNISGYIYDVEKVFAAAREKNPEAYLICDAVQHAPHGVLAPEKIGADLMHFAPYKFFGIRGFGVGYLSERAAKLFHNRLLGTAEDNWDLGSPAPAHYAAISEIIGYVCSLGEKVLGEADRRTLFAKGMERIADHERALLEIMLNGTEKVCGLRQMQGLKVQMDGQDLRTRDFIIGIEFENMTPQEAVAAYDAKGVITFERTKDSIYSSRMVRAFGSQGVVRVSPLHVNTAEEMEEFLQITQELVKEH